MNWKEIEPKIQSLQNNLQHEMQWVKEHSLANEKFPKLNATYDAALRVLNNPEYEVVVCGEVKKGKSSLLNAIIGKELLPVDSNIATSQVFHITNCDAESFEIVFTDGSRMPISQEQLHRYGSQVDVELKGEPSFCGRTISFIQVNTPVEFLPKGVNIVDTPGLGSLYKSHEWITQNYVTHASAVVFVLDPEKPIAPQEKLFINKVLDVTPYILFVMTKIDLYTPEKVKEQIERDRQILKDIYGQRNLPAPQICPVSSKTLMDSAIEDDAAFKQANYEESLFPKMKDNLMITFYRAIGLLRSGIALTETANHVNKVNSVIVDMIKATVEDSQKLQKEFEEKKMHLQERLQKDWGADSNKFSSTMNEITAICNSVTNRVQQITAPSGSIYTEYLQKIDSLKTMDDVKNLCQSMPDSIKNDVESQWRSITGEISGRVEALLSEVQAAMDHVMYEDVSGYYTMDMPKNSMNEKFSAFRTGFFSAGIVGSIGGTVLGAMGLLAIPVVGWGLAIGAAVVGFFTGREALVDRNKQNMRQGLSRLMGEISAALLNVKPGEKYSMAGKFAMDLRQSAERCIREMLDERKKQMQHELDDLLNQSKQEAEKKRQENVIWTQIKQDWDTETTKVKSLITLRKEIASQL